MLHWPVAFVIVPLFGFANAGVSLAGTSVSTLADPHTLGVAVGLVAGKLAGVLGVVWILVRLRIASLPASANWTQMTGVSLLCGIGFTMSLFISLLAFDETSVQDKAKIGILLGSVISGCIGSAVLLANKGKRACRTS